MYDIFFVVYLGLKHVNEKKCCEWCLHSLLSSIVYFFFGQPWFPLFPCTLQFSFTLMEEIGKTISLMMPPSSSQLITNLHDYICRQHQHHLKGFPWIKGVTKVEIKLLIRPLPRRSSSFTLPSTSFLLDSSFVLRFRGGTNLSTLICSTVFHITWDYGLWFVNLLSLMHTSF